MLNPLPPNPDFILRFSSEPSSSSKLSKKMAKDDRKKSNRSFFDNIVEFKAIGPDGLIETEPFLNAAKCIVQFVELFGVAFKPVRNDIHGNIQRLWDIYEKDRRSHKHLNSIVKIEKETLPENVLHVGTDSLIWLNRALIYNQIFLQKFFEDYYNADSESSLKKLSEDLTPHFTVAYELTLKKHHGWFTRQIFSCCMMAAPSRTTFLDYLGMKKLNLPPKELRNLIVRSLENYLKLLKSNTDAVSVLLFSHGFQP